MKGKNAITVETNAEEYQLLGTTWQIPKTWQISYPLMKGPRFQNTFSKERKMKEKNHYYLSQEKIFGHY